MVYPLDYREEILAGAREHRLDPALVAAVIYEESKFDPNARSHAGALGLMQVMPQTGRWAAKESGEKDYEPRDLFDPAVNIALGCWYLRYLIDRYEDTQLALAAYNGGQENLDRWMKGKKDRPARQVVEEIPFKETKEFVDRVSATRDEYLRLYRDELY